MRCTRLGVVISAVLGLSSALVHTDDLGSSHGTKAQVPVSGATRANVKVMTVPELIRSYGYPSEEHFITTSDGYILALHRIPHGIRHNQSHADQRNRIPVFLGHCLVGSSAIWAFGPTDFSLAYLLADAGYDVWMPNLRGSTYSKNHTHFDSCMACRDFWNFGIEESAVIDYPESIDYILAETGHEDLFFVGYSMATTQYLMLLSERPEYNDKIRAGFLLGITAFGGNATNPLTALSGHAESISYIFSLLGINEILPNYLEIKSRLAQRTCTLSPTHAEACRSIYSLFMGMDSSSLDLEMVPTYMSHMPCGASLNQMVHFAQLFRNGGRFCRFDYGAVQNLLAYGHLEPPDYALDRVTAPTALFVGDGDGFGTPRDADKLAHILGPDVLIRSEVVPYSHLGFIWSVDAKELVYDRILAMMDDRRLHARP